MVAWHSSPYISYILSTIHLFEPVPAFYAELSTHWAHYKTDLGYDATTHNYGLGLDNRWGLGGDHFLLSLCRTVFLAAEDLDGQGTFGMAENTEKKEIPLEIREGASVLRWGVFILNTNTRSV